jgi:serine/threonine protein kinase
MHEAFTFENHFCMVFESLGPSLYDFLKRHDYQPFPMVCIQDFAVQLLETLEFLHSFRLIHTDLKIENVLLMNDREVTYGHQRVPESTRIKVIDFGGACYDDDKKSSVINTRQYRAPEVILGTGWSMPSDMWSAGCILAELYQGELLFSTHDNLEHLALMERMVGPFPRRMLKKAKANSHLAKEAFDSNDRHRMDRVLPADNASFVKKSVALEGIVRGEEESWFLGLLRKILVIDPTERATAHECLQYLSRMRKDVVRYN